VTDRKQLPLAIVSSAYNEAENLEELYSRCRAVHAELQQEYADRLELQFRFVVADNGSTDSSLTVLEELAGSDGSVMALANAANYGPEASVANALQHARDCDLVVVLCSDLQHPPEMCIAMVQRLLEEERTDALLAITSHSAAECYSGWHGGEITGCSARRHQVRDAPAAPQQPCRRNLPATRPCLRESSAETSAPLEPIHPLLAQARGGVDQQAARRADDDSGGTIATGRLKSNLGVTTFLKVTADAEPRPPARITAFIVRA